MSIFNSLTTYGGQWEISSEEKLSSSDVKQIAKAEVVSGQFGKSLCFILKSGQQKFIPVSNTSDLEVGDEVNVSSVKILTLSREGNDDIFRAEGTAK